MIYPPRLNLATLPTPLVKLSRFSERLGGVNLWIKRDEMTGVEVSGNKIRKLEFCIAEAQRQGCDTLITCGGIQSNHCRATAIMGARLGLKVQLILRGEEPQIPSGNLFMDLLAGAEISYLPAEGWACGRCSGATRFSISEKTRTKFILCCKLFQSIMIFGSANRF